MKQKHLGAFVLSLAAVASAHASLSEFTVQQPGAASVFGASAIDSLGRPFDANGPHITSFSGSVFYDQVGITCGCEGPFAYTTTFTFNQAITAFAGLWNLSPYGEGVGNGLKITLGGKGGIGSGTAVYVTEADFLNHQSGYWGFQSTNAFTEFTISYNDKYEGRETYSLAAAVPEPQAYAMLLAGLGIVGWLSRPRRKQGDWVS